MNRCPESTTGAGHISGYADPSVPGRFGHGRALCVWCHEMIRIDTSQGAQWVLDIVTILESPV